MAIEDPVVLLPGIMGSRLYFNASEKYCDPDSTWRMLAWLPRPFVSSEKLRQQIYFRQPASVVQDEGDGMLTVDQQARGWSGVSLSFYGEFLKGLEASISGKVYAIGYDWRQEVKTLGKIVGQQLLQIIGANGPVIVVTHSMGGMILRAALQETAGLEEKIKGVIHVFQPVHGAVVLYRRFFTGIDVPGRDGSLSPTNLAFRWILGGDGSTFTGNASGLPGAVQLLPGAAYPATPSWHSGLGNPPPPGAGEVYRETVSPPGLSPDTLPPLVRAEMRSRLEEYDAAKGVLASPRHPSTWNILGTGLSTDQGGDVQDGTLRLRTMPAGDGTVPVRSSMILDVPPERQFMVDGVAHGDALGEKLVQNIIFTILSTQI
jgi:hypothetical protein